MVVLSIITTFSQEYRSSNAVEKLQKMINSTIDVYRLTSHEDNRNKYRSFSFVEETVPHYVKMGYKNGEYQQLISSLKNYSGKSVLIRLTVIPGTSGNALFIDNINVNNARILATPQEMSIQPKVLLSPNPVINTATVNYELPKSADISFNIYNVLCETTNLTLIKFFNN